MTTITLEKCVGKSGDVFERFVDNDDADVIFRLKKLDLLAYEGEIPELDEIPLIRSPERHISADHYALLINEKRDNHDMRIIATVHLMSPLLRKVIDEGYGYKPEFMSDYLSQQLFWMQTAYNLKANGRKVEELSYDEKVTAYFAKGTPRVYKLYYCLKHPERVQKLEKEEPILVAAA